MDSPYGTATPARSGHKYKPLPSHENEANTPSAVYVDAQTRLSLEEHLQSQYRRRRYLAIIMTVLGVFLFLYLATAYVYLRLILPENLSLDVHH